ncbi:ATP-binding protein [Naasia lichenicola]|uniref:histidine kinase n=1 Tax=Naasia lichenicola TaxID=2565933 RepID=A0A4S4FF16_9MICO|nr:ATP-binding protein [Naasia lichenicola]THG28711.1 sensor histidine kinase KdpD [Naasia lichenicola]
MTRGRLRVLLGAAPGVGKTFAMLEEGHRLRAAGRDVVIAIVETHDRAATAAQIGDLDLIPRRSVDHRGVLLQELDVEAVLRRAPDVALVDELAHTNAPGSGAEKRWQDVDRLLDAGIDVLSTVNVQHIESLNDPVRRITGVQQRETIPDAVLRSADQVEVVDLAPQTLRDRLNEGKVYPAARVDAALSNYFRLGNLTALRELALLWLADEVDVALQQYRTAHGIAETWEARERIVVALTGGPEGETLIRRAARIAARSSGGQVYAVHVSGPDGLAGSDPAILSEQRALVESLGGSYHQVVGDPIPSALVDFARGVNATQLVIGSSRRNALAAVVTGPGIGATVVRLAGDIDVHIVTHAQAGRRALPKVGGALSTRRRVIGFAAAIVGLPLLTLALEQFRADGTIGSDVLAFQLFVVIVALIGGIWPALFSAAFAGFLLDFFFVHPLYTVTIASPNQLIALLVFLTVATLVSVVVDRGARQSRAARRSAAEAETLAAVAGSVLGGQDALEALVTRLREAFGASEVVLREGEAVLYSSSDRALGPEAGALPGAAPHSRAGSTTEVPIGDGAVLALTGKVLQAADRRLLGAFASQMESALAQRELARAADALRPIAEADRLRTALLLALGHDLRRPLAAATAAVTGLRSPELTWTAADRAELLDTASESLGSLGTLIGDLLDVSRIQAGALDITIRPTSIDDIIIRALDELGVGPGEVVLTLTADLPAADADPALLQRVLVNLLSNALRFSPPGSAPLVTTSEFGGEVQLRVVDTGPGIPDHRRDEVFVPFQRLGDTDNTTGLGLGLALSKGFVEGMGGRIEVEDTPGGGSTMVVSLRSSVALPVEPTGEPSGAGTEAR